MQIKTARQPVHTFAPIRRSTAARKPIPIVSIRIRTLKTAAAAINPAVPTSSATTVRAKPQIARPINVRFQMAAASRV